MVDLNLIDHRERFSSFNNESILRKNKDKVIQIKKFNKEISQGFNYVMHASFIAIFGELIV